MGDHPNDENRSVWVAESEPARAAAPLRARISAEVVIVGGGFTGVSTAWHLRQRRPDLGIVLLEAGVLGQGASGRNGGQVLNWINGVTPRTRAERLRIHGATSAGIELAESLSARFAPGAFRRHGALEIFTSARRAEQAHERTERLLEDGIPARFLTSRDLAVQGAHGAMLDPLAGRLDGFALLQALRPALLADGIELYEHSRVTRVRGGPRIQVETATGEVRAQSLVLATNAYTPALGFFRNRILPLQSHVVASEPLSDTQWARIGWGHWDGFSDDLDRIAYACRTPKGRLLFGGGANAAYSYPFAGRPWSVAVAPDDAAARSMRSTLGRYFPELTNIPFAHRWSGALAITLDRVCSIGVGGPDRNIYHALGYSGHGVALALLAGRVLADLYDGHHEPWQDLPFYQKRLPRIPPEPLRWLGYHAYTRLTGRSPRVSGI